jgi:coenzyme F420-0:L-glutamate ligase/coenzyme F420-1:gamma-L-glutamate ligase
VIINDSHGRAWRTGTVGVALGAAGVPALLDLRGAPDLFDYPLQVTQVGLADEIAAAASLLMGQAAEGRPIIHIRGVPYPLRDGNAQELIRAKDMDMFR